MANVDPDSLRPLLPSARTELARQITEGKGDAAALVANSGWSWNLATTLVRAIDGEGCATAVYFWNEGIPAAVCKPLADAIASRRAEIAAAAVGSRGGKVEPANQGARRGAKDYVPKSPYRSKLDLGW